MKVGIVGAGKVGATAAYAMVMKGVGREIVLVDLDKVRTEAEAMDIRHAIPFSARMLVRSGDYEDLKNSDLVVITAGTKQPPGSGITRLDLLEKNAAIFKQIIPNIIKYAPNAVLLVATNPVDIMTHIAAKIAEEHGMPKGRVLGTGTTLDTARFRSLLSQKMNIDSHHIHGYVLGEHGDSEIFAWSSTYIGVIPIDDFCKQWGIKFDEDDKIFVEEQVREAGYKILDGKGATYYGIGAAITRVARAILRDERSLLTVCAPMDNLYGVKDVTVSMPNMVGGEGVLHRLDLPLNMHEERSLIASATLISDLIKSIN